MKKIILNYIHNIKNIYIYFFFAIYLYCAPLSTYIYIYILYMFQINALKERNKFK